MSHTKDNSLASLRIAVIGGGIAGLTAAWKLRRELGAQANIVLAEAYGRLGGKLKTVNFSTGPVDMGAEAYLGINRNFTQLIEELGLADQLRQSSGLSSGLLVEGHLVDIPRGTLMGIPRDGVSVEAVVGAAGAQRIDAERRGQPMTWNSGDDTTVGQLVEARLGRVVVDRLVSPLLGGVYSCTADDLGVRATLPDLAAELDVRGAQGPFFLLDAVDAVLERRQATATGKGPGFLSLDGGYRSLAEALATEAAPEVMLNTGIEHIGRSDKGWYIDPLGEFDAVIIATPAPTASVLLKDMASEASEILGNVELASSVVVGMRMDSDAGLPLRSGVLLGQDAPTDAKAFTFSSRKWPHLAQRGGAVVRASFGTFRQPWYLDVDDRALLAYAIDDLQKVTGERKHPREFFVQRWWGGLPRYGVGYREGIDRAYEQLKDIRGLALAGSMLNGVGVPATAETGLKAAEEILQEMA